MRHMVESLSLGSGAILIAVLSAIVVWLLCCFLPRLARSLWIYAVPFALSYSLYWLPVWLGSDSSEYGAWQAVFIIPWFAAGAASSALTVWSIRRRRRRAESAMRAEKRAD
jgi:peptidoglycan/LPS O-acetylase OafA/YrhL